MKHTRSSINATSGFSLIDLLATLAVFATMAGIAIPMMQNQFDSLRLGAAMRDVERELQTARLKAVSANQPIRVRFNCPGTGQYRIVELLGTPGAPAADDATTRAVARCSYPFPPDPNPLMRSNQDGPVRRLDSSVAFNAQQAVEFWPDGTAHVSSATNPWPVIGATGVTIRLARGSSTKSLTVNGLGKIQIQ